jgi:eukaryotic-like serine/threonine-protein kinase
MKDFSDNEHDIFIEAVQLPAEEQAAYLDQACGGDVALREHIQDLLKAHENADKFLAESPVVERAQGGFGTMPGEKVGDLIGRYKLSKQIGEGGCGIVFMAEQLEPVRRPVAIKIIKLGMDTKYVIARFEAERQALALMDHPNIAKIFDAGATESGRPYFVMELVRGVKITKYCDQNSLTTEERLKLFVQICQAIQHAHQKGVIHRDIKPSNVLVTTTTEGEILPVVIDFGVAKATANQRLTDKTVFTSFEMLIGTPDYMSPEQAALASTDVDTRTDIYSLGVLLYELLTGFTPFDAAELQKAGLDEVRRVIREREPVRPSTRLSKMADSDLATVAWNRRVEPPKLIRAISGDLDWIVMKALEKDRTRRYETANGLALDIQRFLKDEPVAARPPSTLYKLKKTLLRNKLLFLGLGAVALCLIVSLIIVSMALAREKRARQDAQEEAAKSKQVTQFLENMLQSVDPSYALGQDTTMLRGILDRTAESIGTEMTNQPAVEAELRSLIGRVYLEIGAHAQAQEMQQMALAINRRQFGPQSREAAASLNDLGQAYAQDGKLAQAVAAYQEALAIRQRYFGNERQDVATSLNDLAEIYLQQGRSAEAEPFLRESLGIRQQLFGSNSLAVAESDRDLGILLGDKGEWEAAESTERQALTIRQNLLKPDDPHIATSLTDVAWAAGGVGNLDEAETLEREALAIRLKVLPKEHPDIAKSLYLVGDRLRQRGKLDDALAYLNQALVMQRKLLTADNPNLLDTLHSLGLTLEAEGKLDEAERVHREAMALWYQRGSGDIPQALSEADSLAHVLIAENKLSDAEKVLDQALTPEIVQQPSSANLLSLRVDLTARRGRWQEAAADAALVLKYGPDDHLHYHELAPLLAMTHNRSAYKRLCQEVIARFAGSTDMFVADRVAEDCLLLPDSGVNLQRVDKLADTAVNSGSGNICLPFFQTCKAMSDYRQGRFKEAAEWAQKASESPLTCAQAKGCAILAMADWQLGQKDAARAMLAKGDALAVGIFSVRDPGELREGWVAWLHARVSLDEAGALIMPEATSGRF